MQNKHNGFGLVGIIALVAVIGISGALFLSNSATKSTSNSPSGIAEMLDEAETAKEMMEDKEMSGEEMAKDDMMDKDTMKEEDSMMKDEAETLMKDEDEAMQKPVSSAGTYETYSPAKLALANNGQVALFFHAAWCPTCRALESDINANLEDIPSGMHILKIDYDNATDLRQKYGVTRQHTLVVVDANGNKIKTVTSPTNTLAQVVAAI